jgi:hypothetical protein
MATYRLLSSIVVNIADGTVLTAGQTVRDSGPGAQLPPNFVPNGCCDPTMPTACRKCGTRGR